MMDRLQKNDWLHKYHLSFWYLALSLSIIISALLFLENPIAQKISLWSVILFMILTVGRLVVFAMQFKSSNNKTFMIWSYAFMMILAVAIYLGVSLS